MLGAIAMVDAPVVDRVRPKEKDEVFYDASHKLDELAPRLSVRKGPNLLAADRVPRSPYDRRHPAHREVGAIDEVIVVRLTQTDRKRDLLGGLQIAEVIAGEFLDDLLERRRVRRHLVEPDVGQHIRVTPFRALAQRA